MLLDKIFTAGQTTSLPKEVNPLYWNLGGYVSKTAANKTVTEPRALQVAAYYACVRNISEDTASLPLHVYRKRPSGGRERDDDHRINALLQRKPNPLMSAWTMRQAIMANAVSWGNGYAEIVRDNRNRPVELWLIHPTRVTVHLSDDGMELYYKVYGTLNNQAYTSEIDAKDMLHLKGLTLDGFEGVSVLHASAEALGIALAEQEFTGAFLGNGAAMSGVLSHPKSLKSDALNRLRESWASAFKGSANAGKPAILEEGMEWKSMSIPQRDAQFLEQRQFGINEICRWFRMPPHKIQHLEDATYSNIESQDRQYVNDTLIPWLTRWEEELTLKLFSTQEVNGGVIVSHRVEGRLRGDASARADYYQKMLFTGAMTVNEARELENLNPIGPNGDVNFMQSAMVTLDTIVNPPEPEPPAPPPPVEPEPPEEPEEDVEEQEDDDNSPEALGIILRAACERVVRKTVKATSKERDEQWLTEFYVGQAKYLAAEVKPIAKAFGVTFAVDPQTLTIQHFNDVDSLTELLLRSVK